MWRTALRVSGLSLRRPCSICRSVRLPLIPPPPEKLCVRREYSSQPPSPKKMVVVGIPNPFILLRTKLYFFLIRTYLDRDFSIDEFNEGARQAFIFVSKLLSQRNFDALENLVAKDMLNDLKDKCSKLSDNYRKALAAESDEIMYLFPGDVGIYYEDNGRKFVNILMRFWYLKHVDLKDDDLEGTKVMVVGNRDIKNKQRILTANYEFRREFTQGVKPDWIITHIEHSKLLE
ncbi:m-AAA protease-interacting protein 1, mitochondrial [Pyxicephalus adspersus]